MDENQQNDGLIAALKAWGCDVDSALPRFLDDRSMYATFIRQVVDEPSFVSLGKAIESGDAKASFEKAHELKGVVANMALTPIYETVVLIAEPLRAGKWSGVKENYAKLTEQWAHFRTIVLGK
jgi:hypothetical protein